MNVDSTKPQTGSSGFSDGRGFLVRPACQCGYNSGAGVSAFAARSICTRRLSFQCKRSPICILNSTSRCHTRNAVPRKLPVDVGGLTEFQDVDVDHETLLLALVSEDRQPGAHALNCSLPECDGHIGGKLSSMGRTQHVCVREESDRLFIEMSMME